MSELGACPLCKITKDTIKGKPYEDRWDSFKPVLIETDGLLAPTRKAILCQNCGLVLPNISDISDCNTRPNDAKMDEVDNIETYIKDVHNLIVTYYGDDALTEADVREVLTAFRHLVCKQSEGSEQS